jgi:hypothetical protein
MRRKLLFLLMAGIMAAGVAAGYPVVFAAGSTTTLTVAERNGLIQLREEEKLARDVYLALYAKWGKNTFNNISRSEATHMAEMKALLDKYGIPDPVKSDQAGTFTNPEFQKLYTQLVAEGSKSLADAMRVGDLIEELDIYDLQQQLKLTTHDDIKIAYQNLMKGSRNHLRTFNGQLRQYGAAYQPKYLSQAEFLKIINSPKETGGEISDPNFKF